MGVVQVLEVLNTTANASSYDATTDIVIGSSADRAVVIFIAASHGVAGGSVSSMSLTLEGVSVPITETPDANARCWCGFGVLKNPASGASTVSVDFGTSMRACLIVAVELDDIDQTTPTGAQSSGILAGTVDNFVTPGLTTTVSNSLVFYIGAQVGDGTPVTTTGATEVYEGEVLPGSLSSSDISCAISWETAGSVGAHDCTFTFGRTDRVNRAAIELIPTSGGGSTVSGDGSSDGTSTASGAGSATAAGSGASDGSSIAAGPGSAIAGADGASDGSSTAAGQGTALAAGDGSSGGAGAVSGAGSAVAGADGASDGSSTVSSDGSSVASGDGASAGVGSASGQGQVAGESAGQSDGSSSATGQGQSIAQGDGVSDGAATAAGDGQSIAAGDGSSAGSSTASGASEDATASSGQSDGSSTATGDGQAVAAGAGASGGDASASGEGQSFAAADGASAGSATASGVGQNGAMVAVTPAERILKIEAEDRVLRIPAENRILKAIEGFEMERQIKDPAAILEYQFDWTEELAKDGDTISSYSVAVTPAGLVLGQHSEAAGVVTQWVSGGTVGVEYLLDCTIMTQAGRTDSRKIRILVQDK